MPYVYVCLVNVYTGWYGNQAQICENGQAYHQYVLAHFHILCVSPNSPFY